jgi:hypothetical protein
VQRESASVAARGVLTGLLPPPVAHAAGTTSSPTGATYRPADGDVYKSSRWADLRARGYESSQFVRSRLLGPPSIVDDIVSLADGGVPYDRANLRGLCYYHDMRRSLTP